MKNFNKVSKDWWEKSAIGIPKLITETPGPKSKIMHEYNQIYERS